MRWKIVDTLGALKDARAVVPLVERVVSDPSAHVRWRALWALAVLDRQDEVVDQLMRRLQDADLRWNAAVGLSMFGHPDAVPVLLRGLDSRDSWIRFEAINALGRCFDGATSEILAAMLEHPDRRTRQEVVMSLGKIGDAAAVRGLIAALLDPSPQVRWRAAMGLERAADPTAIDRLAELMQVESDAQVRRHAAHAIAQLCSGAQGEDLPNTNGCESPPGEKLR